MADKARHAHGSRANLAAALSSGAIDAYDVLFLSGPNESPAIGWVDKYGNPIIVEGEEYVINVTELPTTNGKEGVVYIYENEAYIWNKEESKCISICKPTDLTKLEEELATKASVEEVGALEAEIVKKADADKVETLESQIAEKVDAATVQTMIEEKASSVIEIIEF